MLFRSNWILKRKSGGRWRPEKYYPSPDMLLESFYEQLLLSEPRQASLIEHIEHCYETAVAASDLLAEHIDTLLCEECRKRLAPGSTSLEMAANDALFRLGGELK